MGGIGQARRDGEAGRASLVAQTLPGLQIDLGKPLDLGGREIWVELGFGGGEHLAAQAAAHPDVLVLGAEPFVVFAAATVSGARASARPSTPAPTPTNLDRCLMAPSSAFDCCGDVTTALAALRTTS